jgi:hypothetical protein
MLLLLGIVSAFFWITVRRIRADRDHARVESRPDDSG